MAALELAGIPWAGMRAKKRYSKESKEAVLRAFIWKTLYVFILAQASKAQRRETMKE